MRTPPPIIGLVGRKRAGKDTVARYLLPEYQRRAFADALRIEVRSLYADTPLPSGRTLAHALDADGWETLKSDPVDQDAVRALMQDHGLLRRQERICYWMDQVINDVMPDRCVITDARFPDEIDAIRARGGVIVRVENPTVNAARERAADTHITERAWRTITPDYWIVNPGDTVAHLRQSGWVLRAQLGLTVAA